MDSLEILLEAVGHERDVQLTHSDSLDTKAGVLIGVAGALISLSPTTTSWARDVSLSLISLAGFAAAAAFFPRRMPTLDPVGLRRYLLADPDFTRLELHDAQVEVTILANKIIRRKARVLEIAFALLGLGVITLGFGLAIGGRS